MLRTAVHPGMTFTVSRPTGICLPSHSRPGSSTSNRQPQPAVSLPACAQPGGMLRALGWGGPRGSLQQEAKEHLPSSLPSPQHTHAPARDGAGPPSQPHTSGPTNMGVPVCTKLYGGAAGCDPRHLHLQLQLRAGSSELDKEGGPRAPGTGHRSGPQSPRTPQPRTASQRCQQVFTKKQE